MRKERRQEQLPAKLKNVLHKEVERNLSRNLWTHVHRRICILDHMNKIYIYFFFRQKIEYFGEFNSFLECFSTLLPFCSCIKI